MFGIITAVNAEKNAVIKIMRNVVPLKLYDIELYKGKINNTTCILAMSGIGKINAARCTQLVIDKYNPSAMVSLGSAGALDKSLEIGDIIISDSCIQHDLDLTAFGFKMGCLSNDEDEFIKADPHLIDLSKEAISNLYINTDIKVLIRRIATGDQFCNLLNTKKQIYNNFNAYCVDMESAAVAQVCHSCSTPFVVIRSISDKLDHESTSKYLRYHHSAVNRCATFLADLITLVESNSINTN